MQFERPEVGVGALVLHSLVAVAVGLVCWYYWTRRRILLFAWRLPTGLPALPFIGHGYLMLFGIIGMMNLFLSTTKSAIGKGIDVLALWIGPYPVFRIMDSEDAQTVLNSSRALERGPEFKFAEYAMGRGLITAPVPVWKITRRHINPMFNPRNFELLMPVLNECGKDLVLSFSSLVDKGQVDVEPHVYSAVFKATCVLVFGPTLARYKLSKNARSCMESIDRGSRLFTIRMLKFWLWPDFIFEFLHKKDKQHVLTNITKFVQLPKKVNVVTKVEAHDSQTEFDTKRNGNAEFDTRRNGSAKFDTKRNGSDEFDTKRNGTASLIETNLVEQDDSGSGLVTLVDVYKNLQKTHPSFTDKDFQGEAITMLGAGSETSRITVSTCLLALGANPSIQERLYREIESVMGQDSEVTLDAIKKMPYLDQVLKETMRKFPIVPATFRKVQSDIKLSKFTLPAGSTVGVVFHGVHFDPRHYPDPERFDPDRFSPENVARRAPHTFVAFGGGPRNCIGKTYTMILMKMVLVHVLRKFQLSTNVDIDNLTYVIALATFSVSGYHIQLKNR